MKKDEQRDQIVQFLRKKYHPKAIVLAGSRALNLHSENSDWDIFLFSEKEHRGGFFKWSESLLDLTFHVWPKAKDYVLTIPYGPLHPVQVLLDETHGELKKILKRTEKIYRAGPLKSYKEGCAARLQKLDRWKTKIQKHEDHPEVQFYYAGYVYEFFVRVWFEQQNMWPLPPAQAFPYIKKKDPRFWKLLSAFTTTKGEACTLLTDKIIIRLHSFR
jgi:hypothetical protein